MVIKKGRKKGQKGRFGVRIIECVMLGKQQNANMKKENTQSEMIVLIGEAKERYRIMRESDPQGFDDFREEFIRVLGGK